MPSLEWAGVLANTVQCTILCPFTLVANPGSPLLHFEAEGFLRLGIVDALPVTQPTIQSTDGSMEVLNHGQTNVVTEILIAIFTARQHSLLC